MILYVFRVSLPTAASGTGIQLLSFPGEDPVSTRGQVFFGRAAECIEEALTRRNVGDGSLVPGMELREAVPLFHSPLYCRPDRRCLRFSVE